MTRSTTIPRTAQPPTLRPAKPGRGFCRPGRHVFATATAIGLTSVFAGGAMAQSGRTAPAPAAERGFLSQHTQLTFPDRYTRAGEAYFDPSGTWVIYQATPVPLAGENPTPHYEMYVARLDVDGSTGDIRGLIGEPIQISAGGSANTCGWFHPSLPGVVLFGSTTIPPAIEEAPGYSRDRSRYTWLFPREMNIVTRTIPEIVEDLVEDPAERAAILSRPDVNRNVPIFKRDGYAAEGSWSPDARSILYTWVNPETRDGDLYVYIPELDEHREVVIAPGYDGGPFFSACGKFICYRSDREQNNLLQLFVAELEFDEAGLPKGIVEEYAITDNRHVNWAPFWHPSGRYLVYATSEVSHTNYEVFAIGFDSSAPHERRTPVRVTFTEGFDGLPVFNSSGSHMMWTAQRGEDRTSQLWVARVVANEPPGLSAQSGSVGLNFDGEADAISAALTSAGHLVRRFSDHVTILASEWMQGRLPGSAGIERAEDYIVFWFEQLGLRPAFADEVDTSEGVDVVTFGSSYRQSFEMLPGMRMRGFGGGGVSEGRDEPEPRAVSAYNIGGVLPGRGALARELVVVGAHHDHLGFGRFASRGTVGEAHLGADDNASGVAGVLLLAELLSQTYAELDGDTQARSVLFVTFSGEESGLVGARHYAQNPIVPIGDHVLMLNMDMIGRVRDNTISVAGAGSGVGLEDVVRASASNAAVRVQTPTTLSGRSDHAVFYEAQVPVLFAMITNVHDDYHTEGDVSWKINRSAATGAVQFLHDVIARAALRSERFVFSAIEGAGSDAGAGPRMGDIRVRFGIMPGNYADPVPGVEVERVTPGASAAASGIEAGDRLMTWNGAPIESVGQWMGFLSGHSPGDVVTVGVDRQGRRLNIEVKLLAREP